MGEAYFEDRVIILGVWQGLPRWARQKAKCWPCTGTIS